MPVNEYFPGDSGSYTVPEGVGHQSRKVIGGGGGGGSASSGTGAGGGGGGGGTGWHSYLAVTPGDIISYSFAAASNPGESGGNSDYGGVYGHGGTAGGSPGSGGFGGGHGGPAGGDGSNGYSGGDGASYSGGTDYGGGGGSTASGWEHETYGFGGAGQDLIGDEPSGSPVGGNGGYGAITDIVDLPPYATTDLALVSRTGTAIDVQWTNQSTIASGIYAYIREAGGSYGSPVSLSSSNTSYQFASLNENTAYDLKISPYNGNGETSAPQELTSVYTRPGVPTITSVTPGSTTIDLEWYDNSSSESGYYAFIAPNAGSYGSPDMLAADATTHQFTDLTPGTTYKVKVAAYSTTSGLTSIEDEETGVTTTSGGGTTHHVASSLSAFVYTSSAAANVLRHASAAINGEISTGSATLAGSLHVGASLAGQVQTANIGSAVLRHVYAALNPSVSVDPISGGRTIHVTAGLTAEVSTASIAANVLRHVSASLAGEVSTGSAVMTGVLHVAAAISGEISTGAANLAGILRAAAAINGAVSTAEITLSRTLHVGATLAGEVQTANIATNVLRHVSASLNPSITVDPITGARTLHVTAGLTVAVSTASIATAVVRHVTTSLAGVVHVGDAILYRPGESFGMGRSITLAVVGSFYARESVDDNISPGSGASGNSRVFDQYGVNVQLSGTSEPAVDGDVVDLSCTIPGGGTVDFDLTACPAARDVTLEETNQTGRRLIAYCVKADRDNDDPIAIAAGATNGYNLFGSAGKHSFFPGQTAQCVFEENAEAETPLVASDAKILRVSGTAGDSVNILMVFGTPPA